MLMLLLLLLNSLVMSESGHLGHLPLLVRQLGHGGGFGHGDAAGASAGTRIDLEVGDFHHGLGAEHGRRRRCVLGSARIGGVGDEGALTIDLIDASQLFLAARGLQEFFVSLAVVAKAQRVRGRAVGSSGRAVHGGAGTDDARRVFKQRQKGLVVGLDGDLARGAPGTRAVRVGAGLQQGRAHLVVALADGDVQRGVLPGVGDVGQGAVAQQGLGAEKTVAGHGAVQGRVAAAVLDVEGRGNALRRAEPPNQLVHLQARQRGVAHQIVDGRVAVAGQRVGLGPGVQQHLTHLCEAPVRRHVQRPPHVLLRGFQIGPQLDQQSRHFDVAQRHGQQQRCVVFFCS